MAKNKLPEGYKGVDKLIEEFRKDNPKGKIETAPVLLGDGYVIITAKVIKDDGAVGSGMADADVQDDKSVEKAESGAIRRALLTLGYKSVEADEAGDEKEERREEKSEKRSFRRDDRKEDRDDDKDSDEEEEKEEKPRSRFGNKNSDRSERSEKRRDRNEESDGSENDDEEQEEGQSKFKRGSRFQRS